MFRLLFLLFLVMSSAAFAQTERQPPISTSLPEAIKFDEFEKATNGNVKMRMDAFFVEISNNPTATGYIINYGTPKEIAKRERQLRNAISFRRYDATRITFVNGGNPDNGEVIKTLLFLVPFGAETPTP